MLLCLQVAFTSEVKQAKVKLQDSKTATTFMELRQAYADHGQSVLGLVVPHLS